MRDSHHLHAVGLNLKAARDIDCAFARQAAGGKNFRAVWACTVAAKSDTRERQGEREEKEGDGEGEWK